MRGADSAVMTGFDRLSYQSRWLQVAPERKFLLWLLLMVLAFTLPAWGQALTLALTAALTCWLLRVSFWRWCRWMALPFGFLLVGVLTILFSVSRDPQMLLASFRLGAFSIGISAPGLAVAGETFWRSLATADYLAQARSRTAAVDGADPADLALHFYSVGRGDGDSPRANPAFWLW